MNSPNTNSKPARRWLRWLGGFVALCVAPFVVLALVAASYLGLDRNAAALRRSVVESSGTPWKCQVALNVGSSTLGAVGRALQWNDRAEFADARLALQAVKRASVGVYARATKAPIPSRTQLLVASDRAMAQRGWVRLAGVRDDGNFVLIYTPERGTGDEIEVCLAVLNDGQLVVVSTRVHADDLGALLEHHLPQEMAHRLGRTSAAGRSL